MTLNKRRPFHVVLGEPTMPVDLSLPTFRLLPFAAEFHTQMENMKVARIGEQQYSVKTSKNFATEQSLNQETSYYCIIPGSMLDWPESLLISVVDRLLFWCTISTRLPVGNHTWKILPRACPSLLDETLSFSKTTLRKSDYESKILESSEEDFSTISRTLTSDSKTLLCRKSPTPAKLITVARSDTQTTPQIISKLTVTCTFTNIPQKALQIVEVTLLAQAQHLEFFNNIQNLGTTMKQNSPRKTLLQRETDQFLYPRNQRSS